MVKMTLWFGITFIMVILLVFPVLTKGPDPDQVHPLNLMPVPAKWKLFQGEFRLNESFSIGVEGPESQRILKTVQRLMRQLSERTGLLFIQGKVESNPFPKTASMVLSYEYTGKLEVGEDESYTLNIEKQKISLKAKNDIGILRGLETFQQLVEKDGKDFYLASIFIEDKPRFPWRGLLIDSCRHFMPLEVIKRNLDGMCAVKLNVLHWHLTEDQGFRIECKTFPRLHELGSDGFFYTQDQVKEVIDYAAERGIRVMPEFDIPGHSTSWLVGYPELASAPGPHTIERKFGVFDHCFNPILEETYQFFDRFFSEMTGLFPDAYIHIGGDEVNGKHWDANAKIQEFKKQNNIPDNHSLQAYFNRRIVKILSRLGKKVVGWEQILQPDLIKTTIIQSYLGENSLVAAVQAGYPVINSKADELYIDLLYPADFHYLYDPFPDHILLKETEKKLILGSEATMWGELVSADTIDSRIWPRTAAIAERLWSPAQVRNVEDMYRRLENISLYLEGYGLMHKKNPVMMLERLARGMDIQPLKTLVDILKPIILYDRPDWQMRYNQQTPLIRVVDVAVPDSLVPFEFQKKVNGFLESQNLELKAEIKTWLLTWKNNHRKLKPIIDQSPILGEIEILSETLTQIAEIGLEALDFTAGDKNIDGSWVAEKKRFLEKSKPPQADLMFMIIPALEKLLERPNQ